MKPWSAYTEAALLEEGPSVQLLGVGPYPLERYTVSMFRPGVVLVLFLVLLTQTTVAHAQFSSEENPINSILTPTYPRPYQTAIVSPRSSLIDLSASTVVISVNGTVIQRGSGTQGAAFRIGGPGETTTVVVTVTAPGGKVYTDTITVRPADVALVVEPATTVHPFYKGLPLVAPEGRVRLVAVPDLRSSASTSIDPSKLVYTWKLGERVLTDASGIGRSVLVATAPIKYRDATISLLVTSQDSSVVAQASTVIEPSDAIVRMYPYDPLLGPNYDLALENEYTLNATEGTLRAIPYFFSSSPTIEWSVGGVPQSAQRDITVRATGSGRGATALEVRARITGTPNIATNRSLLRFGESVSPFSIFGF